MTHDAALCFVLGDSPLVVQAPSTPSSASRRASAQPGKARWMPAFGVSEVISDTAHHEGAHAVVAILVGVRVDYVTVVSSADHDRCAVCICAIPFDAWTIEQALLISAAGPASDLMIDSYDCSEQAQVNRFDRARMRNLLAAKLYAHPASDLVTAAMVEWQTRADSLVTREWSWIDRVARRLDADGRLSGTEVERLRQNQGAAR